MSGLTAYAGGLAKPERPARAAGHFFAGAREDWCAAIAAVMVPMLGDLGIAMSGPRQIRFAITAGLKRTSLGLAHPASASSDGRTNFIDVSTAQAEPDELAHTVLHELLHAFDDCNSGHRGRWKRWANLVGINTRGHERGPVAQQLIDAALDAVGVPGQHVPSLTKKAKRRISQVHFWCPAGHGHAHVPARQVLDGFRIGCASCGALLLFDEPAFIAAVAGVSP